MEENPSVKPIGSAAPAGGQRIRIIRRVLVMCSPQLRADETESTDYTFCAMRFWEIRQEKK